MECRFKYPFCNILLTLSAAHAVVKYYFYLLNTRFCKYICVLQVLCIKKFTIVLHLCHLIFALRKRSHASCQHFFLQIYLFSAQTLLHKPEKMLQSHRMRILPRLSGQRKKGVSAVSPLFLPQKKLFRGFFHENLAEGFGMQPFPHA